jgi:hypothetical protein
MAMTTNEEIEICQRRGDEYFQLSRELVDLKDRMSAAEMGIREMEKLADLYQRRLKEGDLTTLGLSAYPKVILFVFCRQP